MHRRPIVIGNWKMHTTLSEAILLARRISRGVEAIDGIDVVLLPPSIWLPSLVEELTYRPAHIRFGVQNIHPAMSGAFTGETGLEMIHGLAQYVLVGHSERRTLFGETDDFINQKMHAVLRQRLTPILCVGELTKVMLKSRSRGRPTTLEKQSDILRQLRSALEGVTERTVERLIICYEPLWAIGSGNRVSGAHVQAVIEQLRQYLTLRFGPTVTGRIRTIYGGSVTADVMDEYLLQPDIDGVLVGGASQSSQTFLPIIEALGERVHHRVQHQEHGAYL